MNTEQTIALANFIPGSKKSNNNKINFSAKAFNNQQVIGLLSYSGALKNKIVGEFDPAMIEISHSGAPDDHVFSLDVSGWPFRAECHICDTGNHYGIRSVREYYKFDDVMREDIAVNLSRFSRQSALWCNKDRRSNVIMVALVSPDVGEVFSMEHTWKNSLTKNSSIVIASPIYSWQKVVEGLHVWVF
jgi:hypothetical protein